MFLRWVAARLRTGRDERGSFSLEIAVLFPVVLLLTFGVVQAALWFHARDVALSAAQNGVRAARAYNGSQGAGQQQASAFLTQAGGSGVLKNAAVFASRGAQQATVTVTGQAPKVITLLPTLSVTQTATGPVERFTTQGGG